ncbi:MAG: vitamin K epoxide reductase family protein [Phycisphaeraceae bacterium]
MNRERVLIVVSSLLTLGALGLSVYLLIQTLSGNAVAGCGADSGCGEVLASRWAKAGPIPVALLGALTYLLTLVGLALRWNPKPQAKLGSAILWLTASLLLVGAIWFIYLQVAEIDALCPYCMACHLIGFVLAILLIILAAQQELVNPKPSVMLGVAAGLALIVIQLNVTTSTAPQRAPNPFANQDGDTWIDDARYVSLFGGELQFVLQDVPYIGDPNAKQVVAVLFDYACPHCKTLHEMLDQAIKDDPSRFVLVPIPLTIDEGHNPYLGSDNSRFDDSMERAILSLAVGEVDREKWKQFDAWLFNADGSGTFPRSSLDARIKAEQLVGNTALNEQLTGENLAKYDATLKRNIDLLGQLPEDNRYIPITTTPGAPEHLTTRYDDIEVLYELLDSAEVSTP